MNNDQLRRELEALRRGDRDAFVRVYHALSTPLFTILARVTRDRALAEDLLQELFLKLYQSPPGPEVKKPRAYLFQWARNLAVDAVRRRPDCAALEEADRLAREEAPLGRLDLEEAMAALSLEERQLVALHLNGGLKFREIAPMVGAPLGTVLWRYRKAIGKLREQLNGGSL